MMKFREGDKVKFLNEKGGGVISKIVNPNLVHVAIEEGFDIPVLPSDLIKVESDAMPGKSSFNEDAEKTYQEMPEPVAPELPLRDEEDSGRRAPLYFGRNAVPKGVYLAFAPVDQKFLISGEINFHLLNNTPYEISFQLFTKTEEGFELREANKVGADESMLLESIARDDLAGFTHGFVQMMLRKDTMTEIIAPVHEYFKVQGGKFFQENAYKKSQLLNQRAIVITLSELAAMEKVSGVSKVSHTTAKEAARPKKPEKPQALIDRHKSAKSEAEVDLHISALKEDYSGMSNYEILSFQLSYFETTLESAMVHHYNKVTYIHGIGNGTLKSNLKQRIKEQYPDFIVRTAPFARYGNGAIEVLINHD
ncbi:MAG: DUF2027 domain-containing protein [Bacteroidota bacterium]